MINIIKGIINWKYERASWQWDVLCIVIMGFIFLTPKEWFNNPRTLATQKPAEVVQVVEDCGCEVPQ
ncbi:hypothetical protein BH10ACI3_BH10ACI3_05360 [soil metagenome]